MKILSRLLGVTKELDRELEDVRRSQDDASAKVERVERAQRRAEQRLEVVEARIGIAARR